MINISRLALAVLPAWLPVMAAAATYQVQIDTTPLAGRTGFFAFDLTQGTPGTINQVTVSAFSTSGALGAATVAGNATGSLAGTMTLSSSTFLSEWLQAVSFAAGVTRFNLSLGSNHLGADIPDQFAFFLLDGTLAPFTTSDPTGAGALIAIDLQQPVVVQTFVSPWAVVSVLPVVPEPATVLLTIAGACLLAGWSRRPGLKETPGRSQVSLTPSGGLTRSGRFGGAQKILNENSR